MARFGPKYRKIPVPKRHGVRDPLKRIAEREEAIKDKINNPPKEKDVQEVSQRFKRFVALKEQANRRPDRSQRKDRHGKSHAKINIGSTVLKKHPRESEQSFLDRATELQEARSAEAEFGVKFGVEVQRNDQTGGIKILKRKGAEVDAMLHKIIDKKEGKISKADKRAAKSQKKTFAEKKALKEQKLKERKQKEEDLLLKEYQYDYVPFGEVVKGPPTLHTLPRRANKQDGASRPGSKRLLLHSLIDSKEEEEEEPPTTKKRAGKKAPPPKVDLKGKRKHLPMATRMKIEREQQNVIEMYRKLKKKTNQV